MTDEEMAEEYRKSLKQRLIDEDDFERLEKFDENVEEAFLAGLKADRPQWHYDKNVTCGKAETIRVIIFDNKREPLTVLPTTQIEFINGQKEHIIAWCELPTFDKEKGRI